MPSYPGNPPTRRTLSAALLAGALWAACTSPTEPGGNAEKVSARIGTEGGTLVSMDGRLRLTVPAGALARPETLSIVPLDTARLGPEFDGVPVTLAFELAPSGMQFATPVTVSFASTERAVVTDTTVTMKVGSLLTSAGGRIEALDSVAQEVRGDTIVLTGRLKHFSQLVVGFYKYFHTAAVAGVPERMTVRGSFTVVATAKVQDGSSIRTAEYRDGSSLGLPPVSIPSGVYQELPQVSPSTYQDAYSYTCTTPGLHSFRATFRIDPGVIGTLAGGRVAWAELGKDVSCDLPQLKVTLSGSQNGMVASNPAGIACVGDCVEGYPHASVVTLTATATPLSKFVKWSGDCTGTNPVTTVLMDKDRTCDAEFRNLLAFLLNVRKSGTGIGVVTSSPAGIACGIDCLDWSEQYAEFTLVTLTASPLLGSTFGGWSGDCNADGKVTMDAAKACTARFDLPPVIISIQPSTITAGGADLPLTVNGQFFVKDRSAVSVGTTALPTTFVSAEQLTATVPAAQVATAGTKQITVHTQGVGTSAPVTLTVKNPSPTLIDLFRTSAEVGEATFTMTVTGSGFVPTSVARWNEEVHLPTAYVNATTLTVEVNASLLNFAQAVLITVVNPAPGGGTSGSLPFEVVNGVPTITLINPASAAAGGPAFELAVLGTKFLLQGTVVRFNGVDVPTTRNSSTTLTANIPASAIATAGSVPVTVRNPAPGGGTSPPTTFTINATADPCNVQTPLAYGGASAAGTLTTGDCNLGFGAFTDYTDHFSLTTTQQANLVTINASPQASVRLKDGDVYTNYIFSFGTSVSRKLFLPVGSYAARLSAGTGTSPDPSYSIAIGPAADEDLGSCSQVYARPGITLNSQTLSLTDCFGFDRFVPGAGESRHDQLFLALKASESITIVQTSSAYQPVVRLIHSGGPVPTTVYTGVSSCDPVTPTVCSSTLTFTAPAVLADLRVEFNSSGATAGPILGAYTASISRNP